MLGPQSKTLVPSTGEQLQKQKELSVTLIACIVYEQQAVYYESKSDQNKNWSQRAEASSLSDAESGRGGFSYSALALHLFSTTARRRISLISEEPINWTSVGIMGSESKWTQIGQRVNELSGRWNKNRASQLQRDSALSSWGFNLHPLWKPTTLTLSRGQISVLFWLFLFFFSPPFSAAEPTAALIQIQTGRVQAGAGRASWSSSSSLQGRKQGEGGTVCWSAATLPGRLSGSSGRFPTGSSS